MRKLAIVACLLWAGFAVSAHNIAGGEDAYEIGFGMIHQGYPAKLDADADWGAVLGIEFGGNRGGYQQRVFASMDEAYGTRGLIEWPIAASLLDPLGFQVSCGLDWHATVFADILKNPDSYESDPSPFSAGIDLIANGSIDLRKYLPLVLTVGYGLGPALASWENKMRFEKYLIYNVSLVLGRFSIDIGQEVDMLGIAFRLNSFK